MPSVGGAKFEWEMSEAEADFMDVFKFSNMACKEVEEAIVQHFAGREVHTKVRIGAFNELFGGEIGVGRCAERRVADVNSLRKLDRDSKCQKKYQTFLSRLSGGRKASNSFFFLCKGLHFLPTGPLV